MSTCILGTWIYWWKNHYITYHISISLHIICKHETNIVPSAALWIVPKAKAMINSYWSASRCPRGDAGNGRNARVKLFTCPLWRCHGKRDIANTPIMIESCSSKHYSHMSCVVLDLIQSCSIILSIPRDFGNLPNSQIATLFSGKKICPFSTLPSICYALICVHCLPYPCDKNHQITCKLQCQHGEGVNILKNKALLQVYKYTYVTYVLQVYKYTYVTYVYTPWYIHGGL